MKLDIGNFYVKDIRFGPETSFADGILTVNKEKAIAALNPDGHLKDIELEIARPGESIRILPIRAIAAPRFRPDGRPIFPGYIGKITETGSGTTYALKGMSVMSVGHIGGWVDGMVDMTGPGAKFSHYSEVINLVIRCENTDPSEDENQHRLNLYFRECVHLLCEYLGKVLKDQEPEEWEHYDLCDVSEKKLPKVALVYHIVTSGLTDGLCNRIYGRDTSLIPPVLMSPTEVIDGAIIGDNNTCADCVTHTFNYQEFPILRRLMREHGKTVDFVGFIAGTRPGGINAKETNATMICSMAQTLHCDACICIAPGNGNIDVDFFTTVAKLEDAGVKTIGIISENCGRDGRTTSKSMMDAKGNAIVSSGNVSQVYELPALDHVIGDIQSLVRDYYPGAWADDTVFGPSLKEDGSIIVDAHMFVDHDGYMGWSSRTVRDF